MLQLRPRHVRTSHRTHPSHSVLRRSRLNAPLSSPCRDKAPGQKECEEAIERLNACIRELDQASLNILSQSTMPHADSSLKASGPVATSAYYVIVSLSQTRPKQQTLRSLMRACNEVSDACVSVSLLFSIARRRLALMGTG